eukprot:TRINITY_DN716_c0_g2_i2.p1 TRINITY_DN716_c0_g2~~TRINITY_DN716_c0_g2_i2.p1  ORF type:complete len:218 (-),score=48.01 TRINITY_DN716_c0_g2_i2:30-683(-)
MIRSTQEQEYVFKVVLVGDASVGKSSILIRFSDNKFTEYYKNTIGVDFKMRQLDIEGKHVKLQIWDTAGQEQFKTIVSSYYRGAHGLLLCFDLTQIATFQAISRWIDEVNKYNEPALPKVLVGNKADLYDSRQVSETEARNFARANDLLYLEVSAKTGEGIEELFTGFAEELLKNVKDDTTNGERRPSDDQGRRRVITGAKIKILRNQSPVKQKKCC